jgi:penicillin-binding protein 1A
MQLAGNLFLDRSQRTLRRKLQEAFLALEIERRFSKQEILRMYCNQVHFGHGLYGLEAAARHYFDKPARELTTGESATLVGLLPRPASYSPFRDMQRATERRNLVLRRMVAEGYLRATDADRIASEPIVLARERGSRELAPYFNEHVRRSLHQTYGSTALYRGGLVVRTTLDPRLQEIANLAVETGLRQLDERRGRKPGAAPGEEPEAQAALVAIEPSSGEVLALVGGFDFSRSEYDRVTQARRQTGSLFKPFVYAAALSRGWTLADSVLDEPTVFLDRRKPVPYQPENFSRRYYETITLRTALEKSANIATVKLLERIGYEPVIDTARRLGVRSRLRPYPSLALGAFELTLLEVTGAYGAFANQGLLMETHMIQEVSNRGGRTLQRTRPRVTEAVSPQVAYLMNQALSGVIQRGTGRAAGGTLEHTLAGKTGTTDDNSDAWFVGYSPHLVVGVWVGYDEPRSLGEDETGARAALPIWIEFMRRALADVPDRPFPVPPGISTAPIDPRTGMRPSARADCLQPILEVFAEGTEPSLRCSRAFHRKLLLPYPFQRFSLDANGSLMIPRNELERLLEQEQDVRFRRRRSILEAFTPEGIVRLPVTLLPASDPPVELASDELSDAPAWIGTDGRPAQVIWFDERSAQVIWFDERSRERNLARFHR